MAGKRYFAIVVAMWLLACVVQLALHRHNVANFAFPDVDDQLRLVEVRDWLGGQAFTDVSQHRMNQPLGAPMHWSRLVDMPLAAVILLFRPLIGEHGAELVACVVVPLLTLGLAMLFTGLIARRLGGPGVGLLATALSGTAVSGIIQMQPMRVDHHGWEITLSLIALHAALAPRGARGGLIAGLATAVALQISLEVLPFAVALGGTLALHWMLLPARETRLRLASYVVTLAVAEALLFLLFHRSYQWGVFCDAVSPPHLLGLGLAALGVAAVTKVDPSPLWARVGGLGATAAIAAAAFHAVPPGCGLDAFSSLEPIVRTYWYDKIAEGLPVWREDLETMFGMIGFPLLALPCAAFAWHETRRAEWGVYTALLLAATAVAVMVLRAGALASLMAVPAAAWVALRLLARAQASPHMLVRVFGSVAVLLGFSPWMPGAVAAIVIPGNTKDAAANAPGVRLCNSPESVRALRVLPTSRLFAPLDLGPLILFETPHGVLASGHHRNHVAMADELRAWLGSDETAHAVMRRHGLRYVISCAGYSEMDTYVAAAPGSFTAHLVKGQAPAWLVPVRVPGSTLQIWRVAN